MPPVLTFTTLDVFTTTRFAGNPLAIVEIPANTAISTQQMQQIAREFNLSETVFLHPLHTTASGPEWRIRIFMTNAELPFAGHPTIGAACYALSRLGDDVSGTLICDAGRIKVTYRDGVATAAIPHDVHVHTGVPFTREQVYALQPTLREHAKAPKDIAVVSPVKGMNFIYVELPDLESLALVKTGGGVPQATLDAAWNVGFTAAYFYVVTNEGNAVKIRARMMEGLLEDAATGSAACGLVAWLALSQGRGVFVLDRRIEQGVEMGRRSEIRVRVTLNDGRDGVESIELSGRSCRVMEGTISL